MKIILQSLVDSDKIASTFASHPKLHSSVRKINWFGWIIVLFLILYDFRLATDDIVGNMWSELMRSYGQIHLILPWICGFLIGHLFHQKDILQLRRKLKLKQSYKYILLLSVFFVIIGFCAYLMSVKFTLYIMTIVAVLGILAGHILWPIKRDVREWKW